MIVPTPFHCIRSFARYYTFQLPQLTEGLAALAARANEHLKKTAKVWK